MPPTGPDHVFDPRDFIGVRAGYRDLFGTQTSWSDLEQDLSHYSLSEVLEVLGRISAVIKTARHDDQEVQGQVAAGLLGDGGADLVERADRFGKANEIPRVVLFEPLQVASLAKAALMLLPAEDRGSETKDYSHIATALLRVTDLIAPPDMGEWETEDGRRAWSRFLFATATFYRGGFDLHDLARFHMLFLQPHESLISHPDYVDLPGLVASATGLPVHLFWLGVTAIQSRWLSLDAKKAAAGPVFIDEEAFLSAEYHFTREVQDRIISVVCGDVSQLQKVVRDQYSVGEFKPFDLVPLADKPVVRIGQRLFCVSVPLLLSKLTTGLYYLAANSLAGPDRDRFSRFLGAVFERYVGDLLHRMFRMGPALLLGGEALQTAATSSTRHGAKTPDFLIIQEGLVLLIETKARFFPRAVRAGDSWDDLSYRLADIYSRGSRQLESGVELCEQGAFRRLGVDPAQVRAYIPLLVSLDETPLMPLVYDLIAPVQPTLGVSKTVPLQVVGVSEFEALEDAVAGRELNLPALLGYKAENRMHADSLRNVVCRDPRFRE